MVTGQRYGMGIGRCDKLCSAAMGLNLITLFSLSVSIKDCPMLWMVIKSQIYYLERILAYGSGKTRYSLIVGFNSFWTDWLEAGRCRGLSTTLRRGLQCGAWSLSLDGELDPSTGVAWVGLVCTRGINEACVSGYQLGYIGSRIAVSMRWYDLAMV
jgi:hypothetical protein